MCTLKNWFPSYIPLNIVLLISHIILLAVFLRIYPKEDKVLKYEVNTYNDKLYLEEFNKTLFIDKEFYKVETESGCFYNYEKNYYNGEKYYGEKYYIDRFSNDCLGFNKISEIRQKNFILIFILLSIIIGLLSIVLMINIWIKYKIIFKNPFSNLKRVCDDMSFIILFVLPIILLVILSCLGFYIKKPCSYYVENKIGDQKCWDKYLNKNIPCKKVDYQVNFGDSCEINDHFYLYNLNYTMNFKDKCYQNSYGQCSLDKKYVAEIFFIIISFIFIVTLFLIFYNFI